jgi:hypothetical protein
MNLSPRGLALLALCPLWLALASAPLHAAGYELGREVDYIFPSEDLSRRAAPVQVLPGPALYGGEQVQYQAFNGAVYTLTRFRGRYVAVLLPDSWMGEGKLDEPLIEVLVDRSDLLYETYRELVGGEPGPSGLLNIAMVPTCGYGCGYVGRKGLEVASDAGALELVKPELVAGHTPDVISHEMAHNFDIFNAYLGYWGDFSHAWTDLFHWYTYVYSQEGIADRSPEDIFRQWSRRTFEKYIADPSLTWESCLRDGLCSIRNGAWAGTLWRLARLHGPDAIKRYMRFVGEYRSSHPVPSSAEAKNDLHVEAMAAGSSLNLGCYVDAWRWHASAALRARMESDYGPGNPFCEDVDADSFSRLAGDCDDGDSTVGPGATEILNDRDDDCDGMIDDLPTVEPANGDFTYPQPVAYPADITGRITGADSDRFTFQVPSARPVRVELCPDPDFMGWVFFYKRDGSWLGFQYTGENCSTRLYDLDDGGEWELSVDLNTSSQPGSYRLTLFEPDPLPAPPWATTASRALCDGSYMLTATAAGNGLAEATEVRFWVSGIGLVGSVAYTPVSWLRWTPPAGFDPALHKHRAQPLASNPSAAFTALAPILDSAPCGTGVTVEPTAGLRTTEPGADASFTVVLDNPPAAAVTIPLSSSDPGEGTISPASLTFTPADWNVPQTVTVTGVDDSEDDGHVAYTILTGPASSGDLTFHGLDPADVSVINADNEVRGDFFTLAPCRLLDTRLPADGPVLVSGTERILTAYGRCGIPATAVALAANVTVAQSSAVGYLKLYPGGAPPPNASAITFAALQTRTNNAIFLLSAKGDGKLAVMPFVAGGGTVHLIVDVSGYFE